MVKLVILTEYGHVKSRHPASQLYLLKSTFYSLQVK